MKIITLKPKIERRQTCCYCATIYTLEESDVTATIRKDDNGKLRWACDFDGEWKCPGCGRRVSSYLYELPWSWHDAIMARSPGILEEYKTLKAEADRKVRLDAEAECAAIQFPSKFDKLLGWFRFYCSWK